MDAILAISSFDQRVQPINSSNKQMKNPPKNNPRRSRSSQLPSSYWPTENMAPTNTTIHGRGGSIFVTPPHMSTSQLYFSYPLSFPQKPPLLPPPLPISNPQFHSFTSYNNHTIRTKPLSSISPPKSSPAPSTRKSYKSVKKPSKTNPYVVVSSSALPLGPDQNDPQFKVLPSSVSNEENVNVEVLAISSPPPSSLPLPKFFLRPKVNTVSCTVQSA